MTCNDRRNHTSEHYLGEPLQNRVAELGGSVVVLGSGLQMKITLRADQNLHRQLID